MIRICSFHFRLDLWKILWMWTLLFSIRQIPYAQVHSTIDSLRAELQKAYPDTTRVNILNALSNSLIQAQDIPGALPYSRDALAVAEQIHYAKGIAHANLNLGVQDVENKNYASALEKYAISFEIFKEMRDTIGLARYYHRSGNIFFRQKLITEGIERYKIAIQLWENMEKSYPAESNLYRLREVMKICDIAIFIPDYHLATIYCQQGYEFAEKLGNKQEMASALYHLGSIDYEQGNYSACVPNFKKALQIFEQAGPINDIIDKHNISWINYALGVSYSRYLGDLTQGLKYYQVSIKMDEEMGHYGEMCEVMLEMGFDLAAHEYDAEALEQYLSALSLSEKIQDKPLMSTSNRYLGDLFYNNNNDDQAEKYYAAAKNLNEEVGNKQTSAFLLHKMGLLQNRKGNEEDAIHLFNTMRGLGEEMQDTHIMVIAYTNLLLLNEPIEKFPNLLPFFLTDLKKHEKKGYNELTMDIYRFTGVCYSKMQDYSQAEAYFIKSLELAKILKNLKGKARAYGNLKDVKVAQVEFEKALEYYALYEIYSDSVSDEANRRILADIQTKYDTEKKLKEIQTLQSEKLISDLELKVHQEALQRINLEKEKILTENLFNLSQVDLLANEKRLQQLEIEKNQIEFAMQKAETESKQGQLVLLNKEGEIQKITIRKQALTRNYLLAVLGLILLASFLVYNNYITRQKLKLQALRNKIASDLHDDVGSTLSSIYIFSEMARQESKEVMPMLETIGESSKKMLDAMADIVWTINPENDDFEKIIDRMRSFAYELLGAKKIEFEFDAGDELNQMKLPMDVRKNLYLIFKEATNNMVKYADADKAYFSLKEEGKNLTMIIKDNGKGFDVNASPKGNGLKNMRKRAEEMKGTLWVESRRDEGTMIKLRVAV